MMQKKHCRTVAPKRHSVSLFKYLQSWLKRHRTSVTSSILFVRLSQSMQSKLRCKTWELWSPLLTCRFSSFSLSRLSVGGGVSWAITQRFQRNLFTIKRAEAPCLQLSTERWVPSGKPSYYNELYKGCAGVSHRIPLKKCCVHWMTASPLQWENTTWLTLKKMRQMGFYACLCVSWFPQLV